MSEVALERVLVEHDPVLVVAAAQPCRRSSGRRPPPRRPGSRPPQAWCRAGAGTPPGGCRSRPPRAARTRWPPARLPARRASSSLRRTSRSNSSSLIPSRPISATVIQAVTSTSASAATISAMRPGRTGQRRRMQEHHRRADHKRRDRSSPQHHRPELVFHRTTRVGRREARPHRLLRLELHATGEGVVYPRGLPARAGFDHYATPLRHGRGEHDLLPAAVRPNSRRRVGRADSSEDFAFAVKASRYLTHIKRLAGHGPRRSVGSTSGSSRYVGAGKLSLRCSGRLPPNFHRTISGWGRALAALPTGRHAFEFRHPSWFTDPGLRHCCVPHRGVALVIADHARDQESVPERHERTTPTSPSCDSITVAGRRRQLHTIAG